MTSPDDETMFLVRFSGGVFGIFPRISPGQGASPIVAIGDVARSKTLPPLRSAFPSRW
jgi:hypothetical protein